MQVAFALIAVFFFLGCVAYVIGHQLGLSSFDPARYDFLRGVLPTAYVVVMLVVGLVVASVAATVFKK